MIKRFSKTVVLLILTLNVAFAIAVLYVFLRTGSEPSALVSAWFGFTSVEMWSLAKIKIKEPNNTEYEYQEEES